jgi:hypothetical protein
MEPLPRVGHQRDGDDRAGKRDAEQVALQVDLLGEDDVEFAAALDEATALGPEELASLREIEPRQAIPKRESMARLSRHDRGLRASQGG